MVAGTSTLLVMRCNAKTPCLVRDRGRGVMPPGHVSHIAAVCTPPPPMSPRDQCPDIRGTGWLMSPGQLPEPTTAHDSVTVLNQAIDSLARLRTAYWLGDPAVHDARDQELTWAQIGELLGTIPATAARRYRNNPRSA
jgi:hypothetical protein